MDNKESGMRKRLVLNLRKRSPDKNGCAEDTLKHREREREREREENLYNPRVIIFSHLK